MRSLGRRADFGCGRESDGASCGAACNWLQLARTSRYGAASLLSFDSGFALLGDLLFSNAKKVSKNACPCIRPRLRRGSLAPVTFQGPAAKGHPWPIAALAASMPLNPFHITCARPPERGVRRRLIVRLSRNRQSVFVSLVANFQTTRTRSPFRRPSVGAAQGDARHGCRARSDGSGPPSVWMSLREGTPSPSPQSSDVGWKTAQHFPPQATSKLSPSHGVLLFKPVGKLCVTHHTDPFRNFQPARTTAPVRRPTGGVAQGDARHGCRARSEGTGTPLGDGPRSNAGGREFCVANRGRLVRMSGCAFFCLLFFAQTKKSEAPCKAQPVVSAEESAAPHEAAYASSQSCSSNEAPHAQPATVTQGANSLLTPRLCLPYTRRFTSYGAKRRPASPSGALHRATLRGPQPTNSMLRPLPAAHPYRINPEPATLPSRGEHP